MTDAVQGTVSHAGPPGLSKERYLELRKVNLRNRALPLATRLEAYAARGSAEPNPLKCGAELAYPSDFPEPKPPRRYCMKNRVRHGPRCRGHNGRAASGVSHPNYRTGEFSSLMQKGSALWKGYHRSASDADLLNCSEQLRYIDAIYRELVEQALAHTGAGAEAWAAVQASVDRTIAAAQRKDLEALGIGLRELQALMTPAVAALALRKETLEVGDSRRRMVETQGRLLEKGQHMVPIDQTIQYGALIAQCAVNAMLKGSTLREALTLFQMDLKALESGRVIEDAQVVTA